MTTKGFRPLAGAPPVACTKSHKILGLFLFLSAFIGGFLASKTCATYFTNGVSNSLDDWWKSHRFYPDEFRSFFGLQLTHTMLVPESLKTVVENHNIYDDDSYKVDKELYDNYARVFGPYLDTPLDNDRRLYVKWTGNEKKFGVFADQYLPDFSFVCEYAGILVNNSRSTDYQWHYYSKLKDTDGTELAVGLDSQFIGNIGRFVNHDDNPNCDVIYVPWRNRWRIVYVTVRPIYPGEELTVSYGSNYWDSRTINKV
ncbi:hypothetical protein HDU85_005454 [Gaertneriomyces sp. JEL0708]|nr:hypothetical protein HDU85_005454 [Gaertneriomyces sp. JEL0708]